MITKEALRRESKSVSECPRVLINMRLICEKPNQGVMAITRKGLPEPPTIFSGAAMTIAPTGGS